MADATALVDIVGRQSVSGPAGVAASALSAVEAAAGKAGSVLGSLATAAVKTGAALGAIGAAGVVAGLTSAVTAAAGFEKQMSAVGAVSGASAAQMKDLSALALKLGADTSFSASESAQGIGELVKAGVSVADVMGGAAKASLDLAAAGGVDVATAAEIASNAMNVFGIKGKDMAHVADEIAGAANASAIDVNDYKFSLAAAGAVAATVGINFDDLSTAIAVMGQAGIKGSDAGTSLKTMLLNLTPSTKAQIAEARTLGIVTADGANKFFDASGKAKSMAEIAGVLQTATKGLTEQQRLQALQTLFGTDAIRAAAIMAKNGAAGFAEMAGAIGKVSASDVANTRLDNLAGSIEKFKGSAETAAITVGQHLTPPLRRLVDIGTDLLNRSLPSLDRYGAILGSTFDALITRAQHAAPALAGVRDALERLGGGAGRGIEAIHQGILNLINDFGALVGLELDDYARGWDTLRGALLRTLDIAQPTIDTLYNLAHDALPLVGQAASAALPALRMVGQFLVDYVGNQIRFLTTYVFPAFYDAAVSAFAFFREVGPTLAHIAGVFHEQLGVTLIWLADEVWPNLLGIARQTVEWFDRELLPLIPGVADALRVTLGGALYWLSTTGWPALLTAASTVVHWLTDTAVPAITSLAEWLGPKLSAVLTWAAQTGWPMLVAAGAAVTSWITGTAVPALSALWDWLSPKLQAALGWLTTTGWPALAAAGAGVTDWVMGTALPALSSLVDWLGPKVSAAVSWLIDTGWPALVAAGVTVTGWITDTAAPALGSLVDWLGPKVSAVVQWLVDTGWPTLVTAATAVSDWITGTAIPALTPLVEWLGEKLKAAATWLIDTGWPTLVDAATRVSDWVTGTAVPAFQSLWSWLEEKLRPAVDWYNADGWRLFRDAGQAVVDMAEAMFGWMEKLWAKIAESNIWTNLKEAFNQLWDAGRILVEVLWPEMSKGADESGKALDIANPLIEVLVGFLKFDAGVIRAFAEGIHLVAEGFKEMKDALSGMPAPPDWFINILRTQGIIGQAVGAVLPHQQQRQSSAAPTAQASGRIDNSSREAFARTAYPYALQAAGGDADLANHLIASAISEANAGGGKDLAAVGYNFGGIKYDPMASGSGSRATWEQEHGQRVDQNATFADYAGPQEGFDAIPRFIQTNFPQAWARYQQTHDVRQLYADINAGGYASDDSWHNTIESIATHQVAPVTSNIAVAAAGNATRSNTSQSDAAGITSMNMADFAIGNQYELGLPKDQADAACGPAAVAIFMQMMGRTPNAEEVMRIAAKNGWTKEAGMGGPAAFARTLGDLAIEAAADFTPTRQEAQAQLLSGHATAFSTAGGNVPLSEGHYFVAQGYSAETGKFDLGETGGPDPNDPGAQHALAHGSRYMNWDEIQAYAGPIQATISLLGTVPTVADNAERELNAVGLSLGTVRSAADVASHTLNTSSAAIADAGTAASAAAPHITTLGDTIGVGLGQAADAASTATGTIADTFADLPGDVLTSVTQLGDDTLTTMQDAMGNVIGAITDGAGNVVNQFVQLGPDSAAGLATGDPAIRGAVDRWGVGMLASLEAARQQAVAEANTVGQDVGGGIATGLDQSQDTISTALGDAVSGALDDLAKSFEIHSPSQKTRREVGHPLGHGIALGIGDTAGLVGAAMRSVVSLDGLGGGRGSSPRGGNDGGIDYDRLARTVAGAVAATRPVVLQGTAEEQARKIVAHQRREARDHANLRGVR